MRATKGRAGERSVNIMTVSNSNELPVCTFVKVGLFPSREEMETYVARLVAESGISYEVTVYPANAMDVRMPGNQGWTGSQSFAVVARGTIV